MTSLQRDPNRYCSTVYMPMDLAVKIKSEIEGETVERKTRACIHGRKRKKVVTPRSMTIGDYLIGLATKKTKNVTPSAKAVKWGKEMLKKNLKKRKEADALIKSNNHTSKV